MPRSTSPRKLGDISHLYLSTTSSERLRERPRARAVVWLVAVEASVNRAHLASGLAVSFARQAIFVTLLEACRGLPGIGYYFGLDPSDYLALSLERRTAAGGLWNDAVRFSTSADPRFLGGFPMAPVPAAVPHVVTVACSLEGGARDGGFLSTLRDETARVCELEGEEAGRPDVVILAGERGESPAAAAGSRLVRGLFPETLLYGLALAVDRPCGADETLELPRSLASSWPKRVPPTEPFFGDLASNLLQRLSQRRKKAVNDAASA
jgi:hypothetical protein